MSAPTPTGAVPVMTSSPFDSICARCGRPMPSSAGFCAYCGLPGPNTPPAWTNGHAGPQYAVPSHAGVPERGLGHAFGRLQPATTGARLSAFSIDVAICVAVAAAVFVPARSAILAAVIALEVALFQVVWCARSGKTIGHLAVGIRTTSQDGPVTPGLRRSLVRDGITGLGMLGAGVGSWVVVASSAWDKGPRRQGWQDKAARTVTVSVRQPTAPQAAGVAVATGAAGVPVAVGTAAPSVPAGVPVAAVPSSQAMPGPAGMGGMPTAGAMGGRAMPIGTTPVPQAPVPAAVASPAAMSAGPPLGLPIGLPLNAPAAAAAPAPAPNATPAPAPTPPAPTTSSLTPTPSVAPSTPSVAPPTSAAPPTETVAPPTSAAPPTETVAGEGWLVVFDTGQEIAMAAVGACVFGRQPATGGDERAVPVTDPDSTVSKTHLRIAAGVNGLIVTDLGSTNGSAVVETGQWRRLVAHEPVGIAAGGTVRMGDRTFTVWPKGAPR